MTPARVLLLLAALGGGDCTGATTPDAPPPPRGAAPVPPESRPPPAATPTPQPSSHPKAEWPEERASAAATAPEEKEPEKKAERDYAAELLASLGDPASCVKPRRVGGAEPATAAVRELAVDIEAYVVGAGTVSRSYVRAPLLTGDESDCIRRRVEAIRFKTPVDDAPRAVRASFKLALQPPVKTGS